MQRCEWEELTVETAWTSDFLLLSHHCPVLIMMLHEPNKPIVHFPYEPFFSSDQLYKIDNLKLNIN